MHKSSTLTLFDLNGTEHSFTPVFTLLFLAKMAAVKTVYQAEADSSVWTLLSAALLTSDITQE